MESSELPERTEVERKDLSFVIQGATLEALFEKASEQLLVATVEKHESVPKTVTVGLKLTEDTLELLLLRLLELPFQLF